MGEEIKLIPSPRKLQTRIGVSFVKGGRMRAGAVHQKKQLESLEQLQPDFGPEQGESSSKRKGDNSAPRPRKHSLTIPTVHKPPPCFKWEVEMEAKGDQQEIETLEKKKKEDPIRESKNQKTTRMQAQIQK